MSGGVVVIFGSDMGRVVSRGGCNHDVQVKDLTGAAVDPVSECVRRPTASGDARWRVIRPAIPPTEVPLACADLTVSRRAE